MNANQELWEKGDFTRIAATMRESGEELVKELGITNGMQVLDLGGGDGTTALPRPDSGADVVVIDIARNLVEAGTRRAAEEGLTNVRFEQGDASHLDGVADDSFDLVVSIFGAMFAPDPFAVAKEMVRVTKPGGRIVMGNWIPGDPTLVAQILKISARVLAAAARGVREPGDLGRRGARGRAVHRRGRARRRRSRASRATYTFDSPGSPTRAGRRVPLLLRADDERVRGGGEERAGRRAPAGARRAVHRAEHDRDRRRDRDPGDVPPGDGHRSEPFPNQQPAKEKSPMPFVNVKLIKGVFDDNQKQEILTRLTETMVDIEGEAMRPVTWVTIEEVASGEWSIGGKALTTQDVKDLQAS